MSRSCHSATFSSAGLRVAAQHAREPGDLLALDRVALVGHRRADPSGPARNGSWSLAHLRALQVAHLGRQALQAGAGERDRLQQLGVAVAGDDLRGDVLARQPQPRQHARLELGAGRRVGAHRARDRADRHLRERALQAAQRCGAPRTRARRASPRTSSARRAPRGCARRTAFARARARARPAPRRARAPPARSTSPAARSCSASAVSSTSEEVSPKWIQRPASPAEAASTSTNAAMS